jgi:hypothetical protein
MQTISKAEMLSKIVESGEVPFRIKYVRATGKNAGQIVFKNAYYGAPNPHPKGGKPAKPPERKNRRSYLESNAIPMTEFGTGQMLTPFISHIIEFNGRQVIH